MSVRQASRSDPAEDFPAKGFAAVEIAAGLRAISVNGTEERGGIEGDTGAVAVLVHAAHTGVFGDEFLRHVVTRPQFNHEMAAAAAAGARGKVGVWIDGSTRAGGHADGDI